MGTFEDCTFSFPLPTQPKLVHNAERYRIMNERVKREHVYIIFGNYNLSPFEGRAKKAWHSSESASETAASPLAKPLY